MRARVLKTALLIVTACATGQAFAVHGVDFSQKIPIKTAPLVNNAKDQPFQKQYADSDKKPAVLKDSTVTEPSTDKVVVATADNQNHPQALQNGDNGDSMSMQDINRYVYRSDRSATPGVTVKKAGPGEDKVQIKGSKSIRHAGAKK